MGVKVTKEDYLKDLQTKIFTTNEPIDDILVNVKNEIECSKIFSIQEQLNFWEDVKLKITNVEEKFWLIDHILSEIKKNDSE